MFGYLPLRCSLEKMHMMNTLTVLNVMNLYVVAHVHVLIVESVTNANVHCLMPQLEDDVADAKKSL